MFECHPMPQSKDAIAVPCRIPVSEGDRIDEVGCGEFEMMMVILISIAAFLAMVVALWFMVKSDAEKYDTEPASWIGENWTDDELEQTSLGQDIRGKTSLDQNE